jgi:hypothetical protein
MYDINLKPCFFVNNDFHHESATTYIVKSKSIILILAINQLALPAN